MLYAVRPKLENTDTCQLCGANPFQYLTELQQHSEELSRNPAQWMPWNYREALKQAEAPLHRG